MGGQTRADRLELWLETLIDQFRDRVLPITERIGRMAGDMEDGMIARGRNPGLADILIASTAAAHRLTILTANVRHFDSLGVPYLNPFEDIQPPY